MPEKLKILIVTERFYPEEFIINDLAAEWASGDFNVDVLTQVPSYPFGKVFSGYSNRLFSAEIWKGINIYRFATVTGYRNSLFFKLLNYLNFVILGTISALIKARGYDRIFVYHTGPLTLAIPAVIVGKVYGIPVTIWTQDIWPDMVYAYGFRKTWLLSRFLDVLVGFVYRNCRNILVSCDGFRKSLAPYTKNREVHHFPNWPTVTPEMSGGANVKLPSKLNFTFAGNIGKFQNLDNIIRGFAMVSDQNPNVQLNIVGDGSELENLKGIVAKEEVRGVVFWGRKPQVEMPAYFSASDVMIVSLSNSPIFELTVPAKFQAYLAFSKPIFAVINGDVKAMVEKFGVGIWAAPQAPEAIRDGFLKFCAQGPDGMSGYSLKAKELLDTVYDRRKIISGMTKVLVESSK